MALNRDEIRQRIDALECMADLQQAIGDITDVEWEDGEARTLDINVTTSSDKKAVAFVLRVPWSVVLAGLSVMVDKTGLIADVRETVDLP